MPTWLVILISVLFGAAAALAGVYVYTVKNWPRP